MTTQERRLLNRLRALRSRIRALFALHGLGRLLMVVPPAVLLAVLLDYLLSLGPNDFPAALRAVLLVGLAGLAAWIVYRHLWQPLSRRITVDDVALELEGRFPELDDRLATTVNFLSRPPATGESNVLRDAVVADTLNSVSALRFDRALQPRPLLSVLLTGVAIAAIVVGIGAAYADAAAIGLKRLFNPLGDARWPKRNELVLADMSDVVPIGDDYTVRVGLMPGSEEPRRVEIFYRESGSDAFESQVMDSGEIGGERAYTSRFSRVRKSFEYFVTGGDDREPAQGVIRVDARPRPRVESIMLTLTPPAYVTGAEPTVVPGQGVTKALQGSTVVMDVLLNKPVRASDDGMPEAAVLLGNDDAPQPVAMAFLREPAAFETVASEDAAQLEEKLAGGAALRATFELAETRRFDFRLVCVDGFTSRPVEGTYMLEAEPDRAPRIRFERPRQAVLDVTARAVVPIEVFVEDDYGIAKTAVGWQRSATGQGGTMGLPEYFMERGTADRPLAVWASRRWDLRDIEPTLKEGEEIVYRAVAVDNFAWRSAEPHATETEEYRLRVVSVQAKRDALIAQLRALGLRVGDLIEQQEKVQTRTKETRAAQGEGRELDGRLREQVLGQETDERGLKRQAEGLRENFDEVLDQWRVHRIPQDEAFEHGKSVRDALEVAAEDPMPKAADGLRRGRSAESSASEQAVGLETAVAQMQRVIDLLRGSLTELSKFAEAERLTQELRRILEQQEDLTQRTKDHAAKTFGKSDEELTPEQRETQRTLQARQQELSDETRQITEELREKARELQGRQQAVADVLREAAREAELRAPEAKMDRAASQISENQSASAKQNQEGAEEDIEKIIEKLEERRVAELKERIKSLEQLKKELEGIQERQQKHLEENRKTQQENPNADSDKKEAEKLAKDSDKQSKEQKRTAQDTQKLAEKMEQSEAGRATERTQQAGDHMQQASEQLAKKPQPENKDAEKNQEEALKELDQAKRDLEAEIEQAKNEQLAEQLEELREQLARIRDEQVQVREATKEFEDARLADRLQRSDYSRLAFNQDKQTELLQETGDVLKEFEDAQVKVFRFALGIVLDRMAESDDRLHRRLTDAITQRAQEKAIYVLGQLVDALEEEIAELQQEQQAGGGEGGQGQQGEAELVPTLAELKMLRLMQLDIKQDTEQVFDEVRKTEELTPEAEAEARRLGRDQQKLKKLMESLTDPSAGGVGDERI